MLSKDKACSQCAGLLLQNIKAEFYMPYAYFKRIPTYFLFLDFTSQTAKIIPPDENDHSRKGFKRYISEKLGKMSQPVILIETEDGSLVVTDHIFESSEENRKFLFNIFEVLQTDHCEIYKYRKCSLNEDL